MTRSICLLVLTLLCVPRAARADSRCVEAHGLRGNVRTVLISHGQVPADGDAPLDTPRRWERWDVSRDRRTVTIVQYTADAPSRPGVTLWPTTICDFDQAGRLVRTRLKLDGMTIYTTVETTYDGQGRKVAEKSRSRNPSLTADVAYEYAGNAMTTRSSRGDRSTTIVETDEEGRIIREIRRDETGKDLRNVEHRYGADSVETLGRGAGETWRTLLKRDAMGNTVESLSADGGSEIRGIARYVYDDRGNWTRRVDVMSFGSGSSPRTGQLELRDIRYWP